MNNTRESKMPAFLGFLIGLHSLLQERCLSTQISVWEWNLCRILSILLSTMIYLQFSYSSCFVDTISLHHQQTHVFVIITISYVTSEQLQIWVERKHSFSANNLLPFILCITWAFLILTKATHFRLCLSVILFLKYIYWPCVIKINCTLHVVHISLLFKVWDVLREVVVNHIKFKDS